MDDADHRDVDGFHAAHACARAIVPRVGDPSYSHPVTAALLDKIRLTRARVGVIGLGYVRLLLVVEFVKVRISAAGFDIDAENTDAIRRGESSIADVAGAECAVIATDHGSVEHAGTARRVPVVMGTRNVLKGLDGDYIFRS